MTRTTRLSVLLILLLLILTNITATAAQRVIDLSAMTLDELNSLRDDVDAEIASRTLGVESVPTSQDSQAVYAGTRKDPAPIGAPLLWDTPDYYNPVETELTVTKVIRGDAALKMVKSFNRFNDNPPSGQEYIIVYVNTYALPSDSEEQASLSDWDFTFISGSGVEYADAWVSGITPELTNLYPGAKNEGILVGLVDVSDAPLLVYNSNSDNPLWFDLNRRAPVVLPDDIVLVTLQKGDKGDDVANIQAILVDMGYLSGIPDGDFGKQTESAIKAYQTAMGLEATGIADEETQRLILTYTLPSD